MWLADQPYTAEAGWGSLSWTDNFDGIASLFASQRRIFDPIKGTADWDLFQTFCYGQDQLAYQFDVPDGIYQVELYFSEPWVGGAGLKDAKGMRLFDIAINDQVVERDLDIWKQVGHDHALKKNYRVKVTNGKIQVHFPKVAVGQAIINAIAISSQKPVKLRKDVTRHFNLKVDKGEVLGLNRWMDIGQKYDDERSLTFHYLPTFLFGSDYFSASSQTKNLALGFKYPTYFYALSSIPVKDYEYTGDSVINNAGEVRKVYRKTVSQGDKLNVPTLQEGDLFAFQRHSGLQPAFDLKQVVSYKAREVKETKGTRLIEFQKGERRQFVEKDGFVTFEIKVGVADIYSLTLKYHNSTQEIKHLTLELVTLDGSVLKEPQQFDLVPTRSGKWNYINTDSGTMINAGTYLVRVRSVDATDIYIDALDVQ